MSTNRELNDYLVERGVLHSASLLKAFSGIDRANFVGPDNQSRAYVDTALPIGYGATISQPYTVAFMLELLQPREGEKILEVGTGSGWAAALLATVVGAQGSLWGVELIPELVKLGRQNLRHYPALSVSIIEAGESLGLPAQAPFDKILVSAAGPKIPEALLQQLKMGGTMVIPVNHSIWRVTKLPSGQLRKEEYPGFVFVPLR